MRKFIKYIATSLLFLIGIAGTAYVTIEYLNDSNNKQTTEAMMSEDNKVIERQAELKNEDPISILLTGLDTGALMYEKVESSRTDVIMVLTLNPQLETTTITSIPRDTWTVIDDSQKFDKINHAYTYGGINQTKKAVEKYLSIPIDYHVSVNMKAFIETIDAMNGLEFTPNQTFTQDGTEFVKGDSNIFTGEETIAYVRMRKQDEEGDIGRQRRQRQIVDEIMKQYLTVGTITKIPEIYNLYNEHVETNFKIGDFIELYKRYKPSLNHIVDVAFEEYDNIRKHGIYYLYIDDMHRNTIHKALAKNLNIEESFNPIIYPLKQITKQPYFETIDRNYDGIISSEDSPITKGIYSMEHLNNIMKEGN